MRTRPILLMSSIALLLLCAAAVAQRRREPRWDTYQTRHYKILHSCSKTEAVYLGNWMEFVHKAYSWIIKVKTNDKHIIKLFKDRRQWTEYGQPPGAGAYYTLHTKQLVGYYDRRAVFPFFAHEGTHQFLHVAVPNMPRVIPIWFNEGLADCMGSSRVIRKQLRWCLYDALIGKGRSYTIQKAIKEGKAKSLPELFKLTHRQFMEDATLHYAQSWSFVHFLFCSPHVERPRKAIPDGKYKKAIVVYFKELRKETPHETAWNLALQAIGKTTAQLEAEWKEYVLKVLPGPKDDDPFVGVRTQPHRKGGLEVMLLTKGAPAEKSGLVVGDRIIYFNKRKIRDADAFTKEIKKRKPGDRVELVVVRNGQTRKIKLVLGKRSDYDTR